MPVCPVPLGTLDNHCDDYNHSDHCNNIKLIYRSDPYNNTIIYHSDHYNNTIIYHSDHYYNYISQ